MKFAIGIPQIYPDGTFSPSDFRSYLARVEELGVYESAWTQEAVLGFSPRGAAPQLAPLELLTYAAACTSPLPLGCSVFVTTLHTPAHLAKALATLDQLAGGRLEIGVGSGGPRRPFAAFGMSADRWVAGLTEGRALMKALWTEPSLTFDGEFWQLKNASMEPKPYQKPYPRLWFGGAGATAGRARGARGRPGRAAAGIRPGRVPDRQADLHRHRPGVRLAGAGPDERRPGRPLRRPGARDRVGGGRGHGRRVPGRHPGGHRGGRADDPLHTALRRHRAHGADRRPDHPRPRLSPGTIPVRRPWC